MEEKIIDILNRHLAIQEFPDPFTGEPMKYALPCVTETSFKKVAKEIAALIHLVDKCDKIYQKVKEAWTPDHRPFEEIEAKQITCPRCGDGDIFSIVLHHHKCRKCNVRFHTDIEGKPKTYAQLDNSMNHE